MRSLFLKIFFLFWVSNAMVFMAAFFAFTWLSDGAFRRPAEHSVVAAFAVHAATIYEREGKPALQTYLTTLHHSQQLQGFLLNAQGQPLAAPVPPAVAAQIERYPQWITPRANRAGHFFIDAVEVRLTSNTAYRFIATQRLPPRWRPRSRPRFVRLSLFLLATALASGLIALLVTHPLRQLQITTQRFADGNLAIRTPETIRKRSDAIGELGREFDHMAERIETLVNTQNRLLRDVSHELRSPLARIQVATTLAEAHAGQEAEENLERIQTEVQRLNDLIERLLTLIRLESGSSRLDQHEVDVTVLLDRIAADAEYEHRAEGKQVYIEAATPAVVCGDEAALHSAFENVLRNALRYTVRNTGVTVTVESEASTLRIRVRDHGPGVPEAHLERLFEPFFRIDEARSESSGNHGIGLAIARAVIERHGGQIHAHNHPDGGLCVTIDLPVNVLK